MSFARLLDHLAGRDDPTVQERLDDGAIPAARAEAARRLLAAGRRALAARAPARRLRQRALRIFRDAHAPEARPGGILRLVLDNLLRPAPALRTTGLAPAPARFLRFEGEVTVELQVTPRDRGSELRGQVTPAAGIGAVTLRAGRTTRTVPVDDTGLFVFRGVRARRIGLDFGVARIPDLDL